MVDQLRFAQVRGLQMAYRERGSGDPIVFVHGNPTSSFLWRNVVDVLRPCGRCVAPDLLGMRGSGKLAVSGPGSYRFVEHRAYLDDLLHTLGILDRVVLVGHDWGGVLAMDWARRHADAVKGIVYMETLATPVSWADENAPNPELFRPLRSAAGEQTALQDNVFIETILPSGTIRTFTDDEMEQYRRPFAEPGEGRRPTLTWPREIPIDGDPADVHDIITANARWMAKTPVRKLFINADPGATLIGSMRTACRGWPNQREVTVKGIHFLPRGLPPRDRPSYRRLAPDHLNFSQFPGLRSRTRASSDIKDRTAPVEPSGRCPAMLTWVTDRVVALRSVGHRLTAIGRVRCTRCRVVDHRCRRGRCGGS